MGSISIIRNSQTKSMAQKTPERKEGKESFIKTEQSLK
jgi:hypothetical protein